jgi:iron complex outermembrane receptor protein
MASKQRLLFSAAGALAMAWSGGASAQTSPEPGVDTVDDIVVTAQRREERLQDVPISVTALSAAQLERNQIDDIASIQYATPSFTLTPHPGDPTSTGIGLRGLVQSDSLLTLDPAVGVYVDGVYLARSAGGNLNMVDMQRVEVLRGPQGTLFGRNTTGGALNLTSQAPTDAFEGYARLSVGDYDHRAFVGVLNIPIMPGEFDARIAYQHTEHSGYGANTFLDRELSDDDTDFIRASAIIRPNDTWTFHFIGDYTNRDSSEQMTHLLFASGTANLIPLVCNGTAPNPPIPPAAAPFLASLCPFGQAGDTLGNYIGGDFYDNSSEATGRLQVEAWGLNGTVTGDWGTFRSITAYRQVDRNSGTDLDGTPYILLAQTPPVPQQMQQQQFSQELQIFGTAFGDRLDWILGAYYFQEEGFDDSTNSALWPLNLSCTFVRGDVENSSSAFYAQFSYELFPDFTVTAGARHTEDERALVTRNRSQNQLTGVVSCQIAAALLDNPPFNPADVSTCVATLPEQSFSYTPFTVGADWRINEQALVYLKFSRGFRAGGFSLRGGTTTGAFAPFNPEQVESTEAGVKLDLFGRRLRVNAAVYSAEYTDIQQSVITAGPTGPSTEVRNVGEGEITGGEVEVTARLGDLTLIGTLGIVDAEYTAGPNVGAPFSRTPEMTYSLAADYPIHIGDMTLNLHTDYSWRDEAFYGGSTLVIPALYEPAYGIWNAMATLDVNDSVSLSLWGRNLAEEEYHASRLDLVSAGLGIVTGFQGEPRTIGAALHYRFGAQ